MQFKPNTNYKTKVKKTKPMKKANQAQENVFDKNKGEGEYEHQYDGKD